MKTKGIIAAGNPATAAAAAEILEAGGNAFDAAVAAFLSSMVAEPAMSSPGGGGFMTAVTAGGRHLCYDFFVQTPQRKPDPANLDFFPIEINFGTASETFHVGMGSIAIPGSIAGAFAISELGKLPFSEQAAPAIQFAREGARVDDFQEHDVKLLDSIFSLDPLSIPLFFRNGQPIKENDFFVFPGMARLFEALVEEGSDFFYRGELAEAMVKLCEEKGGTLTRQSLSAYRVLKPDPLEVNYRGHRLLTNPLPSIGGSLLALGLKKLEEFDVDFVPGSREHVVALRAVQVYMDQVHLAPDGIVRELERTGLSAKGTSGTEKRGSTTHFNILDEHGNGLSITTSNGEGCGYVVPGYDFMLNNMLGESALLPGGFHSWQPNTRLSSMMSPSIMLDKNGKPEVVLGTGGAGRIPAAILQVLHNLIDHKMSVEEAANAPRQHWHKGVFNLEEILPHGLPEHPDQNELVWWKDKDMFFGGVHTILNRGGQFSAAGDHRRRGVVQVVE